MIGKISPRIAKRVIKEEHKLIKKGIAEKRIHKLLTSKKHEEGKIRKK
jgi:hypothetical protein